MKAVATEAEGGRYSEMQCFVVGTSELENWFDLGGEPRRRPEGVLKWNNSVLILLPDPESIGHLHVLERKFGFEKNDFEVLLACREAASTQK